MAINSHDEKILWWKVRNSFLFQQCPSSKYPNHIFKYPVETLPQLDSVLLQRILITQPHPRPPWTKKQPFSCLALSTQDRIYFTEEKKTEVFHHLCYFPACFPFKVHEVSSALWEIFLSVFLNSEFLNIRTCLFILYSNRCHENSFGFTTCALSRILESRM